jgi:hypothetical protein
MAQLNINGQEVDVPDDLTPEEMDLIKNDSAQPVAQEAEPGWTEKLFGSVDPATLASDDDWLKASNDIYKANTGKDFNGSADDLSEFGLDSMGWFNYNLPKMLVDTARLRNMTDEQKQSFLYMMDTYDKLKVSWSGAGRFVTAAAADPSNWVGLSTFGFSTLASQGAKAATKAGIKDILTGAVKTGIVTAVENGIQSGAQSAVRQQAEANAGRGDGISLGKTALDTAVGAVAGGVIGAAGSAAVGGIRKGLSKAATDLPNVPATPVADEAVPAAGGAPSPVTEASVPAGSLKAPEDTITVPQAANDNVVVRQKTVDEFLTENPDLGINFSSPEDAVLAISEWKTAKPGTKNDLLTSSVEDASTNYVRDVVHTNVSSDPRFELLDPAIRDQVEDIALNPSNRKKIDKIIEKHSDSWPSWVKDEVLPAYTKFKEWNDSVADIVANDPRSFKPDVISFERKLPFTDDSEIPLANPRNEAYPPIASNTNTPEVSIGGKTTADEVLNSLRNVIENNGLTVFPRTREEFATATKVATDILARVHPDDVRGAVDAFIRAETDPARHTALLNTIQRASAILEEQVHDMTATVKTLKGEQATAARQQLEMAKNIRDTIKSLDTAMSSQSGYGLGNRVGEFNVGNRRDQFASEDAYLNSQGIDPKLATPEERQMAEDAYFKAYEDWKNSKAMNAEVSKIEALAEDAARNNDFAEVNKLLSQRDAILDELAKAQLEKQGITSQILKGNIARGFMEYVIGTVFTTGSFVVNTIPSMVKTVYRPALDGVVGGLDTAARRKMAATYGAMLSNVDGALKAAYLSLRYEKTFMTDDVSRMIEAPDGVIPGTLGKTIRFLPNLLNATDVFFMQLNYRGFVAGEATARAYERGMQLGMKGKALDTYVQQQVDRYVANSFSPSITDVGVLDAIRKQGASKGLYGSDLDKWMKIEMARNGQFFAEATHQGGIDFIKDLTFKKEFSKNGLFSSVADAYEKTVAREPLIKLMGQLFFRTPVRVFQEGFRLTPVLGLVTPTRMLSDLMGKNGEAMRTKAMGELLLSQAIMGSFAIMYAKGQLSGGGSFNYKERQAKENTKQYEPYTLTFNDGYKFSYRNLDPFSTPFKIMANVMDRLQMLQYRRSQGEFVDNEEKYVYQVATAALVSVAQAVRDANLTEGINSIIEAGQKFSDPNSDGTFLPKLIFQKIQLVIPNMVRKGIQTEDPTLTDPLTWEQNARALINPGDPKVPKRYDSLGNVVRAADPSDAYVGVRTTTKAQREKGLSEKQLTVLSAINDLEVTNGTYLTRPYKHQLFGDTDLRREDTMDGKSTKYDRMMKFYNESDLTDRLYEIFVERGYTSVGTPRQHDAVFTAVKDLMDGYWDMAAAKVAREDTEGFRESLKRRELDKADVLRGKHAVPPPF